MRDMNDQSINKLLDMNIKELRKLACRHDPRSPRGMRIAHILHSRGLEEQGKYSKKILFLTCVGFIISLTGVGVAIFK